MPTAGKQPEIKIGFLVVFNSSLSRHCCARNQNQNIIGQKQNICMHVPVGSSYAIGTTVNATWNTPRPHTDKSWRPHQPTARLITAFTTNVSLPRLFSLYVLLYAYGPDTAKEYMYEKNVRCHLKKQKNYLMKSANQSGQKDLPGRSRACAEPPPKPSTSPGELLGPATSPAACGPAAAPRRGARMPRGGRGRLEHGGRRTRRPPRSRGVTLTFRWPRNLRVRG